MSVCEISLTLSQIIENSLDARIQSLAGEIVKSLVRSLHRGTFSTILLMQNLQ